MVFCQVSGKVKTFDLRLKLSIAELADFQKIPSRHAHALLSESSTLLVFGLSSLLTSSLPSPSVSSPTFSINCHSRRTCPSIHPNKFINTLVENQKTMARRLYLGRKSFLFIPLPPFSRYPLVGACARKGYRENKEEESH